MNTFDEDRVNFRLQQAYAGGSAIWLARPNRSWWQVRPTSKTSR